MSTKYDNPFDDSDPAWEELDIEQKLLKVREECAVLHEVHKSMRLRDLIYCTLIAGAVSLVIGRTIEIQSFNEQQQRSRINCVFAQRAIRLTADIYDEQADGILGDKKEHIKAFKIKGTPFEDFRPLLRAQARGNRIRSAAYERLKEDCNKVFPPAKTLPFLD